MPKVLASVLLLSGAAVVAWMAWEFVLPRVFETPANLETLAEARGILDEGMPVNDKDWLVAEIVYNHGGSVGITRSYDSVVPSAETVRKFLSVSKKSFVLNPGRQWAYCVADFQVGLSTIRDSTTYSVYAVDDDTAVRVLGCSKKVSL